ncbi:MAG TPA: HAD-IIIA family hydrolase [Pseudobdellovibrionaceae bacterium]|jgi:D-glycero-D-manno-heptose 1,7-bisphosphate phosphatase
MSKSERSLEGFGQQSCLFLDRDGVIIEDIPYNADLTKVALKPGILQLLRKAHGLGMWITVVSNQSGLGRGYFSWTAYRQIHQKICQLLAAQGEWVDLSLCAPYSEGTDFKQAQARPHYRKPDVGMFKHAEEELGISFSSSVMVGDSATDMMPAFLSGVRKLYLVTSEKQEGEIRKLYEFQKLHPDFKYQVITHFSEVSL